MAIAVGSVHVDVVPSTRDFVKEMKAQILGDAAKFGEELGERIGREAAEAVARPIAEGIEDGVEDADTERAAGKKGRESGGAFAREFKARISAALEDLPEVDLEIDDSDLTEAQRELKDLRKELAELRRKNIGVDLDGEEAFAELGALRLSLDSLRDGSIEMDVNVDRAQANLAAFQRQVARDLGGTFDNTLRDSLANAFKDLPTIDLDADGLDPVRRTLGEIRRDIENLSDQAEIDLDIDSAAALAEVTELQARLQTLVDDENIDIKVRTDAAAAIARLQQVQTLATSLDREVEVRVDVRGGFADKLRSSIESALRALPNAEVDVDVDTNGGAATLAALRAELAAFGDLEIDVDFDADLALQEVARLSAAFQAIADDETLDFRVRFDAAQALVGLGAISAAAEKIKGEVAEVEREMGGFARSVRTQFEAALRNLPDIEIDADTDPARARLQELRRTVEVFTDLEIGVDIDTNDALRGVANLIAELQALAQASPEIDIKLNAARVIAELEKIRAEAAKAGEGIGDDIRDGIERNIGGFANKIRDELRKAQATLPDIEVNLATAPAFRDLAELRARIGTIEASIDVDADISTVLAQLSAVELAARALDRDGVDIQIRADARAVLAQLVALRAAAVAAGNGIEEALGESTAGKINRIRLIMAAVLVLFPLIAGAVLGLSAALALVIGPIAAIAAGLDGIKAAFAPLQEEFSKIKVSTSQAFENGLQPAVENLLDLVPELRAGLAGTAIALSEVATGITDVASSGRNIATIADNFDLVNAVIISMGPAVNSLTQNMIDLTRIGLQGLGSFGGQLVNVGNAFAAVIARLEATGTAQASVQALFQVLAALLELLAPLTEFGAVLLASFGPALTTAFQVLGNVISTAAQAIELLPGPLQDVAAIAVVITGVMLLLGKSFITGAAATAAFGRAFITLAGIFGVVSARLAVVAAAFRTSLSAGVLAAVSAGVAGVGAAFRGLLAVIGGPVGAVIIGVVTALSLLGQSQSDAAAAASEHEAAVQELAGALRESNGAITDQIRQTTAKKLIDAGAVEMANELGISTSELTTAISEQGPAYDRLISRLREAASAGQTFDGQQEGSVNQMTESGETAQELMGIVEGLGQEFIDAAEFNSQLAAALQETGSSMVGGLSNAVALEEAMATLGNAASSTSDKVKALQQAMDALNGGTLTAEQALAALEASIDEIGTAFEEAQAAAAETGGTLLTATGAIDTTTEAGRNLFDATLGIRDSMLESATAAFDAAGGLGNVEVASEAAATQVQNARDAFIEAAIEAGIGAQEAENLANRYGLIPSVVTTLLSAEGIPQVEQELLQIESKLQGVAAGTTINIGVPSAEVIALLDAIGIKTTELPGGQIGIVVDDQTLPGVQAALGFIESQEGEIGLTADDAPVLAEVAATVTEIAATEATVRIAGNDIPLREVLTIALAGIASSSESVEIGGVTQPLDFVLGEALATIANSTASVTIGGIDFPARDVLAQVRAAITTGQSNVTIGGNPVPVNTVVAGVVQSIITANPQLTINPRDLVTAVLNVLRQPTSSTHTIRVGLSGPGAALYSGRDTSSTFTGGGRALGGVAIPMAAGGVLGRNLTPLRGGRAEVVDPNTWRVIGDNMKVPEAYIPLDGSARSFGFARQAIQTFGYDVAPMALGGLIASARRLTDLVVPRSQQIRPQQIVPLGNTSETVTADRRGSFLDSRRVEQQLDKIAELLETRGRQIPPITVEDRSGDSVQTARAVQLALRLAR